MTAPLYTVVGPSGAGKDTVLGALKDQMPQLQIVRRVITRDAAAGGEDFEGVSQAEFDRRRAAGRFVLHWHAHGLSYGIERSIERLRAGPAPVLFNGSRGILPEAIRVFPDLQVIHIIAAPQILTARLRARDREGAAEIADRVARASLPLPLGIEVIEIDNSGDLSLAVDTLAAVLRRAGAAA